MKQKFYLTFCASHPQRNNYITIKASNMDSAYNLAVARFGMGWRKLEKDKPNKKKEIMEMEAQ